jgi:hypothetical protein
VSVSRTPGHTKHFQTIFLAKNVRLCDSPGLVFPSLIPKSLQVLAGLYPIAQLRDPYTVIRYLAERIPIIDILQIKHPEVETEEDKEKDLKWSPLYITEAWAMKRRYFTAKAARPDTYRAANEILRMALDGRLSFCLKPKNFYQEIDAWKSSKETDRLNKINEQIEQEVLNNENLLKNFRAENEEEDDEDDSEDEIYPTDYETKLNSLSLTDNNNTDTDDQMVTKKGANNQNMFSILSNDE